MSIRVSVVGAAAVVMVAVAGAPLGAQKSDDSHHGSDVGIALRAGTLGIGGEISKLLVSHVGARVGFGYFSVSKNGTDFGDNNTIDFKAELKAFTALLDLYPGARGAFHLTGGLMTTPAKVTGTGSGGSYSFNNVNYTQAQVGILTAEAKFPSALPYVGLGFGTAASDHGGLSFVLDLGIGIGKPTLSMNASNAPAGSALANNIAIEVAKQQADKGDKIPGWPVFAIGFMYRF